jgi:choline dehydrogenase
VILCGGAVNSPQILQLSGIGPGRTLAATASPPWWTTPRWAAICKITSPWCTRSRPRGPRSTMNCTPAGVSCATALRYLLTRAGPWRSASINSAVSARRSRRDRAPTFSCISIRSPMGRATPPAHASKSIPFPAFTCVSSRAGPPVSAASISPAPDFRAAPTIAPNYLSTEKDVRDVVFGGRLLQAIARTQAMRSLILEPLAPDLTRLDPQASSPIFALARPPSTTR